MKDRKRKGPIELTAVAPNSTLTFQAEIGITCTAQWGWELGFREALIQWMRSLRWQPEAGAVTFLELALDFKSLSRRCLPSSPHSRLAAVNLPLQERARYICL